MILKMTIKPVRNIHDYFGVDSEEVLGIIQTHLPKLKIDLEKII